MKSPPTSVSGFTLTELLVVVAIAGILATIAIPGFKSLSQSQQVKNATFDLYSSLIVARSEAIKRNTDVTITPVVYPVTFPAPAHDEKGWVIAATNGTASTADDTTIQNQSQLKGIVLTVTPANSPWVTYRRTGRTTVTAASDALVFKLDAYGETTPFARCIKIELSGMPRIYKPVSGACS